MKGRVLIYLLIVAALIGVGFAVSHVLMDDNVVESRPEKPSVDISEPEVVVDTIAERLLR